MTPREVSLPRKLSARFKNDFAYYTVKNRLPVTLTKVIDKLSRKQRHFREKYGDEVGEAVKTIVGSFSEMKNQIQTGKSLLPIDDGFSDKLAWNKKLSLPLMLENPISEEEKRCDDYLEVKEEAPSWFNSSWLLVECYFYRRIFSAFLKSGCFSNYDPFKKEKRNLLRDSHPGIKAIVHFYLKKIMTAAGSTQEKKDLFFTLLQASLWANRWDLSLFSSEELEGATRDTMESLEKMRGSILRDDSEEIWKALARPEPASRVDIILDNSGLEVFSDMLLGDFMCSALNIQEVVFHCKVAPWFVSDVTEQDWRWTIDWLSRSGDSSLSEVSRRWSGFLEVGRWRLECSGFWTLPDPFSEMLKVDSDLYNDLSSSSLIFFKGDLNYRKLTGDRKWPISETSFDTALMGFKPSSLCALRTLKSDTLVGVSQLVVDRASKASSDWMVSGQNGIIQFQGIGQMTAIHV